ncbi:MAG: hypothetical protein JWL98_1709 [Xanthomonadaceae bacterium]|nr:hypothetical protein [Xanthomonadaceae bacterium]
MQIGTVRSIDACGMIQVQLSTRIVHARILKGRSRRGDEVEGYMTPGLCTWMSKPHRRLIVDVLSTIP